MRRLSLLFFLLLCSACASGGFASAPIAESQALGLEHTPIDELTQRAEAGQELAILELARRYTSGQETQQDALIALDLYRIIAESNSDLAAVAQTRIGKLYMEGVPPLKQDFVEAYMWFDQVISENGKDAVVDKERVLRLHNFTRINMSDAERVKLAKRLENKTY